jgi:hypothetical protein
MAHSCSGVHGTAAVEPMPGGRSAAAEVIPDPNDTNRGE